jgi:hypothetical protein
MHCFFSLFYIAYEFETILLIEFELHRWLVRERDIVGSAQWPRKTSRDAIVSPLGLVILL